MANYDGTVNADFSQCPYNKSHVIEKHRMQAHLVKCGRQHSKQGMSKCPFNSVHVVYESEFEAHVENCEDRAKLDKLIYRPQGDDNGNRFPIIETAPQTNDCEEEESWDNANAESYNPEAHCENSAVLRNKIGGSKKERRTFKEQERLRLANIEQQQKNNAGPSKSNNDKKNAKKS